VGFFSNDARTAERERVERIRSETRSLIFKKLEAAKTAAREGDIEAEETALAEAFNLADSPHSNHSWNPLQILEKEIERLTHQRLIRKSNLIGFADTTYIWEDRIIVFDPPQQGGTVVRLMSPGTHAEVMTEGQLSTTSRPTLTRMALGSVLPGSALIPGLVFQKTQVHDSRRLFFTIEQEDWAKIIELDPNLTDPGAMRQVALEANLAAKRLQKEPNDPESEPPWQGDERQRLEKLTKLFESGLISTSEYEEKRASIIEEI